MGVGESIKNYAKNKAKKKLRSLLLKLLFPWGIVIILGLLIVLLIFSGIEDSVNGNTMSDELNGKQNTEVMEYLNKKVDEVNNKNTFYKSTRLGKLSDYYEFDQDLVIKASQVKAYMQYMVMNNDNNEVYNATDKVQAYKDLIDKVCDKLKPTFNYEKFKMTVTKTFNKTVYEYKDVGTGLYDNKGNKIKDSNIKIVSTLPDVNKCSLNQRFYIVGKGTYKIELKDKEDTEYKDVTEYSYSKVGNGLYDNNKNSISSSSLMVVNNLPSASDYENGQRVYVINDGLYTVKTKVYLWLFNYKYFSKLQSNKPNQISNIGLVAKERNLPVASKYNLGKLYYCVNENKTMTVTDGIVNKESTTVKKVKAYTKVSEDKPSEISNVQIFTSIGNLPDASETLPNTLFYGIKENKTVKTTKKTVQEQQTTLDQDIYALTKADTIENVWNCTYKVITTETTGHEAGIEGEVKYKTVRPVIDKREKANSEDYTRLKSMILQENPNEDYQTIVSMVKFSQDTSMSWCFTDPEEIANLTPLGDSNVDVPAQLQEIAEQVSSSMGVPSWVLLSIGKIESGYNMNAANSLHCYGMYQFQKIDANGRNAWEAWLAAGLGDELKKQGYRYGNSEEAWSLFMSSEKVQTIVCAYQMRSILNYILNFNGIEKKLDSKSSSNLKLIKWDSEDVNDFRDILRRAYCSYNRGTVGGFKADIETDKYANTAFAYAMSFRGSNDLISFAKKFLGTPYVWGGTTPDGFDCSGFVQYVYKHFGYNLPRTSQQQSKVGQEVQRNELQPGDLIFFHTEGSDPTQATHVGMYIGNNQYIQAPHTGDVVKISTLKNFLVARRYF